MRPVTFTPGPWFVVGPPWGDGSWITNGAGGDPHGGKPVAHEGDLFGDNDHEYAEGEKDANLRLIAAAPDLLASLTDAAIRCAGRRGERFREHRCVDCSKWLDVIEKAVTP